MNEYEILSSYNWQDTSKFKVQLIGNGADIIGINDVSPFLNSINLPDITDAQIEQYIAEEWRFSQGRLESYQITLNFRDYGRGVLYSKFAKAKQKFIRLYPDSQKIDIIIYLREYMDNTDYKKVITFKDSLLLSISSPNYDYSATASIAEFSATFKASYLTIN